MGKNINKFFEFGFLIFFNSIFLIITISLGLADTANRPGDELSLQKGRLIVRNSNISADFENVPLARVLSQLKDHNNIWIKCNESLLDKKISVRFKSLSLEEGLNRILGFINHALIYNSDGSLKGIILYSKSNTPEKSIAKGIPRITESSSARIVQENIEEDLVKEEVSSAESSNESHFEMENIPEADVM